MPAKGIPLDQLTWLEAEAALTPSTVVVIPLGAASKEHGPHLRLNNDWTIAEYFKRRVIEMADVVVAPTTVELVVIAPPAGSTMTVPIMPRSSWFLQM